MNVDVACLGQAFLDLHFGEIDRIPGPGEERSGTELQIAPGGSATVAIACARLGLDTVLLAPRPVDPAGELLQRLLADEPLEWRGPPEDRCGVSVTVPVGGDRSMITFAPPAPGDLGAATGWSPRIAIADLQQVARAVPFPVVAVLGDEDSAALSGDRWRDHGSHVHALVANEREACTLTGATDAVEAARAIAQIVPTAVVTRAERGAVAVTGGTLVDAAAPAGDIEDVTGAGDLFVAALVWGELRGLAMDVRLAAACTYASLSLREGIAARAALTEERLLSAIANTSQEVTP